MHTQYSPARDLYLQAARDYQNGDLQAARLKLVRVRELDPSLVEAWRLDAEIARDQGDRAAYLLALTTAAAAHPRSAELQNWAGLQLLAAGEEQAGLRALRQAVELAPKEMQYVGDLAAAHVKRNDTSQAIAVLTAALEQNPLDPELPLALARLHERQGDWNEAVAYYDAVIRRDESQRTLLAARRAHCLFANGEYQRAYEDYALHRATQGTLPPNVATEYADVCLRIGDYTTAQNVLNELSQQTAQRSKEVEVLRGICALQLGDTQQARQILQTAARQWPADSQIEQALALCTAEPVAPAVATGWRPTAGSRE